MKPLNQARYAVHTILVATFAIVAQTSSVFANSDGWTGGSAVTSNWNDAANWSPGVPGSGDELVFGSSNVRTTSFDNIPSLSVSDISFTATAAAFTFHTMNGSSVTLTGAGIANSSSNVQTVITDEGTSGSSIIFANAATASNLNISNTGTTASSGHGAGTTTFQSNSGAGTATITNNGGQVNGAVSGETFFNNSSTAGSAVITNSPGMIGGASGGLTFFRDSSSAATATITNNNTSAIGAGVGGTEFFGNSTAGSATIINNAGTASGTFGGLTEFWDSSTAGSATIIANGGTNGGAGGRILFLITSDGGTARIEVFGNGALDISSHIGPVTIGSIEGDGNVFLGGRNGSALSVGSNNMSTTFSGVIQDGGNNSGTLGLLTKVGTGTLTLSGTNTYTGGTTVSSGTLLINNASGSGTGTGTVQVNGGTLGGTGAIAGAVTIGTGSGAGASITPGSSIGTLTIQSALTLNSDATYKFELNSSAAVADKIVANGVTINGAALSFTDLGTSKLALGTSFVVIDNTSNSAISGFFSNLADNSTFTNKGNTYLVSYEGGTGNDLMLTVVPEPQIWQLLSVGVALALARREILRARSSE